MPWKKTFDEKEAIKSAMSLFWKKGYVDTSMADLLQKTDLTKGSFYNAFGSKKEMFIRALVTYDRENRQPVIQKLTALDAPLQAIQSFLQFNVDDTTQDIDKKGCFIINTSLELYSHDAETQQIINTAISEVVTFFKQMIELGQGRGEINPTLNPEHTAKSLMSTVAGIRVLGRGVYDKNSLMMIADQAVGTIKNN